MKQIILVLAMVVALAFPMNAQEADGGPQAVISGQIEAFRGDDLTTAFGYASPGIRAMFVTPEVFGAMVQTGYPMVWRPSEMRFGALREIDGVPWQKVLLRDEGGVWHALDYRMIQVDGLWKIDGVRFSAREEVGV